MTQAQKLEALVRKAVEEEKWRPVGEAFEWKVIDAHPRMFLSIMTQDVRYFDKWDEKKVYAFELIFDKDFARALFDNSKYECCDYSTCEGNREVPLQCWQHMLQQAVISDNPVDYYYNEVFGRE